MYSVCKLVVCSSYAPRRKRAASGSPCTMAIRFFCMLVLASVCSAADEKPYTPPSHKELKERLSKDPNFKEKMKGFKPPVGAKGDRTPHDTIKESAKENGKDFAKPDLGELKDKFKGLPEKMKDKNAGVPKIPPEKRPKKSLFGEGDKPDFMKMGKGGKGVDVPSMGDRPLRKDKKEVRDDNGGGLKDVCCNSVRLSLLLCG